jgi:catechol 2,3-dioxygenase-like lactoylglutathione lyase family enzyme
MTVRVEHLLLPSRNQRRAAAFLAELLDLEVSGASSGAPDGYFSVVRVGDITIDYADMERFSSHHVAFAVEDETFDAIFGRVQAQGLEFSADPAHRRTGELNDNDGGRGFYIHDPDGHNLEFLTRPITS